MKPRSSTLSDRLLRGVPPVVARLPERPLDESPTLHVPPEGVRWREKDGSPRPCALDAVVVGQPALALRHRPFRLSMKLTVPWPVVSADSLPVRIKASIRDHRFVVSAASAGLRPGEWLENAEFDVGKVVEV